jgi:hypothetical protein
MQMSVGVDTLESIAIVPTSENAPSALPVDPEEQTNVLRYVHPV